MSEIARYVLDDGSEASFEIEPIEGFADASSGVAAERVRDAARQAVKAALEVFEQVKAHGPSEIELKFGIKVSGKANWLVAKAATEGSFEVTLKWKLGDPG
jgi:hypothetical protein